MPRHTQSPSLRSCLAAGRAPPKPTNAQRPDVRTQSPLDALGGVSTIISHLAPANLHTRAITLS